MRPPIFETVAAVGAVTALLGTNPVRFYSFGEAPATVSKPYAVWRTVYGSPENILEGVPGSDSFGIQIDVYALTGQSARAVGDALQAAIEPVAYVAAYNGDSRDPDTKNYNYGFTVDWMKVR
jgi:hypothetical protein